MLKSNSKKWFFSTVMVAVIFGLSLKGVLAQTSPSVLYVPLIGITSVPEPLALPNGSGNVTYRYAVKNFVREVALSDVTVIDDTCSPVKFVTGDDNGDSKLDFSETWRYTCATNLSQTTHSTATATGTANSITATNTANATVVVNSDNPAPLVSISNVTKVTYPLSLPSGGGTIDFMYKVNNPGSVPLSNVTVTDDTCSAMSGQLGDTNANLLLDPTEVWIYSCTAKIDQTITATTTVTGMANGMKAVDSVKLTIEVDTPSVTSPAALFDLGITPIGGTESSLKVILWGVLLGILTALVLIYVFGRKKRFRQTRKSFKQLKRW